MTSEQAVLILDAVAGASSGKSGFAPFSRRDDLIASLIAKNTDEAKNNGGSPTAYNLSSID